MYNFTYYYNKLLNFYNVSTIKELSEKINIGASTISAWNQRKSITALKKACRKLGIYNEIFGDLNQNNVIQDITNYGNNWATNNGSMNSNTKMIYKDIFDDEILTILKSISPILDNNQSKKDSFKKSLKLWLVENI
ncbi:helix-turn-helix transcriptional regulator [Aliarcobacter butzleri]|uniref:helix-turn-helix domain-containing protein n=1 Tax=Aliarcobacter butzleri TaxID=28197 RepID=UPI0006599D24|nr:helix-turn-helix transcriptional regulator [Aliarcobacter butzleri]KLE04225.1 hypothetical protein AF78_09055 [Aliarcobacter butzleri L353]MCT7575263.1 helix-turn-helix transcriptional regulator [Aliarcobacter butzleri]